MKKKIIFTLMACVALAATAFAIFNPKVLRGNWFQQVKGVRIQFTQDTHDFGKIDEGAIVDHRFTFSNIGSDTLKISNVRASCGCTAALLSANAIAPGENGEIKATLNTKGKQGKIKKSITVTSNDSKKPQFTLYVKAEVVRDTTKKHHESMGDMHGSYFEGKCVACHVEPGIGKFGEALFQADCAMCHGDEGKGAVAFAMHNADYLRRVDDKLLEDRIAKGSPTQIMMRGFAKEHGGPLDAKQIQSLVEYIRSWEKTLP